MPATTISPTFALPQAHHARVLEILDSGAITKFVTSGLHADLTTLAHTASRGMLDIARGGSTPSVPLPTFTPQLPDLFAHVTDQLRSATRPLFPLEELTSLAESAQELFPDDAPLEDMVDGMEVRLRSRFLGDQPATPSAASMVADVVPAYVAAQEQLDAQTAREQLRDAQAAQDRRFAWWTTAAALLIAAAELARNIFH